MIKHKVGDIISFADALKAADEGYRYEVAKDTIGGGVQMRITGVPLVLQPLPEGWFVFDEMSGSPTQWLHTSGAAAKVSKTLTGLCYEYWIASNPPASSMPMGKSSSRDEAMKYALMDHDIAVEVRSPPIAGGEMRLVAGSGGKEHHADGAFGLLNGDGGGTTYVLGCSGDGADWDPKTGAAAGKGGDVVIVFKRKPPWIVRWFLRLMFRSQVGRGGQGKTRVQDSIDGTVRFEWER